MQKEKRSFFERLTGTVKLDEYEETAEETRSQKNRRVKEETGEETEGQLTVDVYNTPADIIIKTMVAGVKPEDLEISINRDMVTIKGKRETDNTIPDQDYFYRELYWGSFSRTILLPQEIDIDESEAIEKNGLLVIKLPKTNKEKQAKLRVKIV
jgi:HSP20 family protein